MKNNKKIITIICPVFNEEENVDIFVGKFLNIIKNFKNIYIFNFLFLDNCSTDKTVDRLLKLQKKYGCIEIIKYSRNFGVMKSIFTGLINSNSDASAVFDCDLQDPPQLLIKFISEWERGYKIIYGERDRREESYFFGFLRKQFRFFEKNFKGNNVKIESGAWFFDERVILELKKVTFEPYLPGLISRLGFKSLGIKYNRISRKRGDSKFGLAKYFSYAADGLVSGTIVPLRIAVFCGILFSIVSFTLAAYFVIAKLFLDIPFAAGMAANIVIELFGFSLTFLFLGVIGEYLGRLHLSSETSQLAIIEETYPIPNKIFKKKSQRKIKS